MAIYLKKPWLLDALRATIKRDALPKKRYLQVVNASKATTLQDMTITVHDGGVAVSASFSKGCVLECANGDDEIRELDIICAKTVCFDVSKELGVHLVFNSVEVLTSGSILLGDPKNYLSDDNEGKSLAAKYADMKQVSSALGELAKDRLISHQSQKVLDAIPGWDTNVLIKSVSSTVGSRRVDAPAPLEAPAEGEAEAKAMLEKDDHKNIDGDDDVDEGEIVPTQNCQDHVEKVFGNQQVLDLAAYVSSEESDEGTRAEEEPLTTGVAKSRDDNGDAKEGGVDAVEEETPDVDVGLTENDDHFDVGVATQAPCIPETQMEESEETSLEDVEVTKRSGPLVQTNIDTKDNSLVDAETESENAEKATPGDEDVERPDFQTQMMDVMETQDEVVGCETQAAMMGAETQAAMDADTASAASDKKSAGSSDVDLNTSPHKAPQSDNDADNVNEETYVDKKRKRSDDADTTGDEVLARATPEPEPAVVPPQQPIEQKEEEKPTSLFEVVFKGLDAKGKRRKSNTKLSLANWI